MHIFIHKTNYYLFKKRIDKYGIDVKIRDGSVQMFRQKKEDFIYIYFYIKKK